MKLIWVAAMIAGGLTSLMASAAPAYISPWDDPANALAAQIAELLGPGQARLTIHNLSTISNDDIPTIRRLLEQDLKTHGVLASGVESANAIRLTLSENQRERLWVAEIVEGNETRVAMVRVGLGTARQTHDGGGLTLRKQSVLLSGKAVLATVETANALVAVAPEEIVIYTHTADGWREQKRVGIGQKRPLARDPRAVILPSPGGDGFEASVASMSCSGAYQPAQPVEEWSVRCHESDDPWPIVQSDATKNSLKAFYNSARNYFTGVISPGLGVDLPPFYSAVLLPRPSDGAALLVGGIDGKVQLVENDALKPVSGARDWGSDFAALHTGCGTGTQIIASGSGEAVSDSLRAYELPTLEAVP
ncbi:MAG: hypothetical protein ABR906_01090, partial [Terracidiphilus sp.]